VRVPALHNNVYPEVFFLVKDMIGKMDVGCVQCVTLLEKADYVTLNWCCQVGLGIVPG
jgi:hypothetical protein